MSSTACPRGLTPCPNGSDCDWLCAADEARIRLTAQDWIETDAPWIAEHREIVGEEWARSEEDDDDAE